MQTPSLPIQLNTAPAAGQRANAPGGNGSDAGQFSAMLSNEMEARQPAPPAPAAPRPQTAPAKPQEAGKPAQPDDAAPPSSPAPADAKSESAQASGEADGGAGEDGGEDADAAPADPASALLALMASLQQPAQDAAAKAPADAASQAFDALAGSARGKRGDSAQLATLQAALKSQSRDGAGKTFAAAGALQDPALAAGAALGADDKHAADGADLRGVPPGAVKAELKPGLDAAGFGLQQARDAAQLEAAQKAAQEAPAVVAVAAQAQPAALEAAKAAAAGAERLSARVGSGAWENQLGQKVVWMVGSEEQTASLTLNPPDLGPMQVVLSVTGDQASVTFSASQQEVRQALENALPRLREMMGESGIALGNATVDAGMPDQRQAQDQSARAGGNGSGRGGRAEAGAGAIETGVPAPARARTLGERGMVDTFA